MFLVLPISKLISTKVAHHIKIPYVKNKVDFSEGKVIDYGGIHNIIYGLNKKGITTYFYMKNGILYYHRKPFGAPQFFWLDPHLNTHKLIEFHNLNHSIKGLENLLIATDKGEWYIISDGVEYGQKKKCLALINAITGQNIFISSQNNNVLLKFFYPLVDSIFPILQVTRRNIFLHLFDLPNNKVEVLTWDTSESIRNLVLILLEKALDDSSLADVKNDTNNLLIKNCGFCCTFYDLEDNKNPNGIGHIKVLLDLTLVGSKYKYLIENLYIKMSTNNKHDDIHFSANLSVEWANLKIFNSKNTGKSHIRYKYSDFFEDFTHFAFLSREFRTTKRINRDSVHINNVLYKSECYYIVQNSVGIRIFEKGNFIGTNIIRVGDSRIEINAYVSMYRFKRYLIVITSVGFERIKLIVIDSKNNSIGLWKIKDENWNLTRDKWIYNYYYDSLYNRLLFLSSDLRCLFFIKVEKIEKAFKVEINSECNSKSYRDIKELGSVFDLNELIIRAINKWYKSFNNLEIASSIKLLSYYIDGKMRKLHVISKYSVEGIEYIGLFVSSLGSRVEFSLISYVISRPQQILSYIMSHAKKNLKAYGKNVKSLFKWGLYRLADNIAKDLDLYYDNDNSFVSINYNRESNKLVSKSVNYNLNVDLSLSVGNMIAIMYECNDSSDSNEVYDHSLGFYCKSSYVFILTDLNLIRRMPITVV